MLFGVFGLGFWETAVLVLVLAFGAIYEIGKKAASNEGVQKGAASFLASWFK
jgi:hypothetical protein